MATTGVLYGSGTPVTTASNGSWATPTNAVGAPDAARAVWTSSGSGANATIRVEGHNAQTAIGATPTSVDQVAVTVYGYVNNTARIPTIEVQLTSGGTLIGSAQTMTASTTTTYSQTFNFTGVTWSQLANLGVRVSFTRAANTQSATGNVDAVGIDVTYTPDSSAPGLVASSRSGAADTNASSNTCPVPAGAAAGMIAVLAIEVFLDATSTPVTPTWPSGFTGIVDEQATPSGGVQLLIAKKTLTGADSGNYVTTLSAARWNMSDCALVRNVNTVLTPDTNSVKNGSGTAISSLSLTSSSAPVLLHFQANNSAASHTPPTNYVEQQEGDYLTVASRAPGTTGAHSTSGATQSTSTVWAAALIGLETSSGGGSATWTGSTASTAVTATSGSFTPGAVTWTASTAAATLTATAGAFAPGPVTWSGSTATVAATATSGSLTPGTATWAASTADITATATSGAFSSGAAPQTWTGSTATATATADAGTFTPGPVTWTGSTATATSTATSGAFAPGTATWAGSTASVAAAAQGGVWVADGAWSGSTAALTATATSGTWTPGPVTWNGSTATATATATGGAFTSAGASWAGSTATLAATATAGTWTPGDVAWLASVGIATFTGVSVLFIAGDRITPPERTLTIAAEARMASVASELRTATVPAQTRTYTVPAESRSVTA